MIIALVGPTYGGKARFARYLKGFSKKPFERLLSYTTNAGETQKEHIRMERAQYEELIPEEIFFREPSLDGEEYLYLKSQFYVDRDIIYAVDDPAGVEHLEDFGVPYVVVYVDCERETSMKRAEIMTRDLAAFEARLNLLAGRMKEFEDSGNYSWYLNTTNLSKASFTIAANWLLQTIDGWMKVRPVNELCMPVLDIVVGKDWRSELKDLSFLAIDPKESTVHMGSTKWFAPSEG